MDVSVFLSLCLVLLSLWPQFHLVIFIFLYIVKFEVYYTTVFTITTHMRVSQACIRIILRLLTFFINVSFCISPDHRLTTGIVKSMILLLILTERRVVFIHV